VERTIAWLDHNRRMSKDYERLCASGEAFVYAAMIRLMTRRLACVWGLFIQSLYALRCIRSSPSLFIRDSRLFATLPSTRCWVEEEVAGLADARKIKELLRGVFGRRAIRVVGVVALLAVVVVFLFLILNWYVAPTKPSERKDLVLAVAQILAGTALLSGLYFTWRTLQVNREGQITERFTRAIDQLGKVEDGHKLFEIRIASGSGATKARWSGLAGSPSTSARSSASGGPSTTAGPHDSGGPGTSVTSAPSGFKAAR
jgi:hypothetical protein